MFTLVTQEEDVPEPSSTGSSSIQVTPERGGSESETKKDPPSKITLNHVLEKQYEVLTLEKVKLQLEIQKLELEKTKLNWELKNLGREL